LRDAGRRRAPGRAGATAAGRRCRRRRRRRIACARARVQRRPGLQAGREDTAFDFGTIFDADVADAGRASLLTEGMTWGGDVRVVSGDGAINDGNVAGDAGGAA